MLSIMTKVIEIIVAELGLEPGKSHSGDYSLNH